METFDEICVINAILTSTSCLFDFLKDDLLFPDDLISFASISKRMRFVMISFYEQKFRQMFINDNKITPSINDKYPNWISLFCKFYFSRLPMKIIKCINFNIESPLKYFIPIDPFTTQNFQFQIERQTTYLITPSIIFYEGYKPALIHPYSEKSLSTSENKMIEKNYSFINEISSYKSNGFFPVDFKKFQSVMNSILHLQQCEIFEDENEKLDASMYSFSVTEEDHEILRSNQNKMIENLNNFTDFVNNCEIDLSLDELINHSFDILFINFAQGMCKLANKKPTLRNFEILFKRNDVCKTQFHMAI